MRFVLDHDVYAATWRLLREAGHDAVRAAECDLQTAGDIVLLRFAHDASRILVTRDRDFGRLVYSRGIAGGVVYLRVTPNSLNAVHRELMTVLEQHSEEELRQAFVVVEPGRHRLRRTPR